VLQLTHPRSALPNSGTMKLFALAVVIAVLSVPSAAHGQLRNIDLQFRLPSDTRVIGFHVYLAASSRAYTDYRDDINHLPLLDPNGIAHYALAGIEQYSDTYVSLKSYDASGVESAFSNEVAFAAEPQPLCTATSCNDGNPCTADSCTATGCVFDPAPRAGSSCDDGNALTFGDVCQSGGTCAGTPGQCSVDADCPAPSDPCSGPRACVAHQCQAGSSPQPDETACNDGSASTRYDVCRAGVCRGFACGADAQCSDGNACNGIEHCVANACVAGAPMVCDDGNACNGLETCQSSACVAGTPPACPTDSGPCFAAYCDASAGCGVQTYPDGTACTSSSGSAGTCSAGACTVPTISRWHRRHRSR
jgi:hypothetical protein